VCGPRFDQATETGCDVLFFYADNFIVKIPRHREQWQRYFRGAVRRGVCLNFDISHAAGRMGSSPAVLDRDRRRQVRLHRQMAASPSTLLTHP